MDNTKICRTLFDALQGNDMDTVKSLCADTFVSSQNGGSPMDLPLLMQFTAAVHGVVPDFRYENPVCTATDTGFVEEHDVCGTLPDGDTFKLVLCVVGEVEGGKVTHLREYVDSRAAAGLIKALRPD